MTYPVTGPVAEPARYLLIAHGSPKKSHSVLLAASLASALERKTSDPRATSIYLTHPDTAMRHSEIADRIKCLKGESGDGAVRVIVLGGDGLTHAAMMGVSTFLAPESSDLFSSLQSGFSPADAMWNGGIQVVALPLGSANDTPECFGTTAKTVPDILKLFKNLVPLRLSLGVATPNQGDPVLITHSFGIGSTSRVFRWTEEWRTRFWSLYGRQVLTLMSTAFPQSLEARWQKDGTDYRQNILEVAGHTIPIIGGSIGFPGTPQEGMGYKVLRNAGRGGVLRPTVLKTLWEMWRLQDPELLLPGTVLNSLPPHLQGAFAFGEETTFTFHHPKTGKPTKASFVANGDFIGETDGLTVATVRSGLLLGTPDSLMGQIQQRILASGLQILQLAS
jgi:hypothetical protein